MIAWLKRVAIAAWRVLDAMADSPTGRLLDQQTARIARLEARIAALEAGRAGAPGRPAP